MKQPSSNLLSAYQRGVALQSETKLYAEWNMNRFYEATVTDNGRTTDLETWDETWPRKSVIAANRPDQGIVRARFSSLTGFFGDERSNAAGFKVGPDFVDSKPSPRYYLVSPDDQYTYWSSQAVTRGSRDGNGKVFFDAPQSLQIVYPQSVKTNKIVIGLECSETSPKTYKVEVTYNGTNWTTIATDPVIGSDGRITLWYTDAWLVNKPNNFNNGFTNIRGIRIITEGMSKQGAPFSVIEISARLQQDLTGYLNAESSSLEVSDVSDLTPLGVVSSNQATVALDNTTGIFYNENTQSPYYGLLDKNVKMWCEYVINGEAFRQWTMFTDDWDNQMSDEVSVPLFDKAEYLQNINPLPVFWKDLTAGSIIWRLLDMAGVAEWNYSSRVDDIIGVPYYWSDPAKTVWENIQDIAQATQTAFYFDEYGIGQIKNAKTLFSKTPAPVWSFSSENIGSKLADIETMEKTSDLAGANQVEVKYTETKFTDFNNGLPKMEVVWEPEDTLTLRASALSVSMTANSQQIIIPQEDAATWPLEGAVNIEGEIISYSGKYYRSYNFYDSNGAAGYTSYLVKTLDEQKKYDERTPEGIRWRNSYTGVLNVTKRGDMGTVARAHDINSKYRYTYELTSGGSTTVTHWEGGVTRNTGKSTVTLKGRNGMTWNDLYTLRTTESAYARDYRYGCRMRIPSGQPAHKGAGGLYIKGGSYNSGFFINLAATEVVEYTNRASRNELRFQIRTVQGDQPMKNYIPPPMQINRDTWYDLEASTTMNNDGTMGVKVYVDGQLAYTTNIAANEIADPFGRFGVFIQDNCTVEFDYLYAVGNATENGPDESSFYDNVKGGFMSNYFEKVVPYRTLKTGLVSRGKRNVNPSISGNNQQWLDEFGPVVHEVRRFDIDFEKAPVAHSFLYFSNNQVVCPAYVSDAYGATFYLANAYRTNAVVKGEDTLTYGTDNAIDQTIFVYGRAFSDEDQQTEIFKDDSLIRRRGLTSLTFESPYIQNKSAAKRLGQWIVEHWSQGAEQYSMTAFGNPFLSLGDVVTVSYPEKEIDSDERFVIVSINNATDNGITTALTLRKL